LVLKKAIFINNLPSEVQSVLTMLYLLQVGLSSEYRTGQLVVHRLSRIVSRDRLPTSGRIVDLFPWTRKVKSVGSVPYQTDQEIIMGKKLYVGNLSYDVKSADLKSLFAPHGNVVSADVIMDRDTGRSKGFGFVEMGTDAEAQAAIAALNGQQNNGRALTVNEAKPREERPRGGGGFGGGRDRRF